MLRKHPQECRGQLRKIHRLQQPSGPGQFPTFYGNEPLSCRATQNIRFIFVLYAVLYARIKVCSSINALLLPGQAKEGVRFRLWLQHSYFGLEQGMDCALRSYIKHNSSKEHRYHLHLEKCDLNREFEALSKLPCCFCIRPGLEIGWGLFGQV